MSEFCQILNPQQKALEVNLEDQIYGTFAEIGAGQEVVRHFFRAGGAAGTIAKAISAYDMTMSDIIYGKGGRYVSSERLEKMLSREFHQLRDRLEDRDKNTTFFAFANTVAAKSYSRSTECHGWMGVRFQHEARVEASELVVHVRMLDRENVQQQEALGALGVNMIHGCFYKRGNRQGFVRSLMDGLTTDRLQIDVLRVNGPAFEGIDSRLLSLDTVKNGYCSAIMFDEEGRVVQVSDQLYKKNILLARGSFRPPTLVNLDMLESGEEQFKEGLTKEEQKNVVIIPEISMNKLIERGEVDSQDFLARVDLLAALNQKVMISNYDNFYDLNTFLTDVNKQHKIAFVTGVYNLREIFDSTKHEHTSGGLLGDLGKLFGLTSKLLVYPAADDENPDKLLSSDEMQFDPSLKHLIDHLKENHFIEDVKNYNPKLSGIWSRVVLQMIQKGESGWEEQVPKKVVDQVKKNCLFGYPCPPVKNKKS